MEQGGETMIDHQNAYALMVQDVKRCAEFYREKVGLEQKELSDNFAYFTFPKGKGPGVALVTQQGIGEEISTALVRPGTKMAPRGYFAVFVEDADKLYAELKAKGVGFVKDPTTRPDGQRYAFFEDPEGNLWEISHFPKG
jgi:catechol 2,3-dioxygenase-like lactoylglutathione lyase family enzyme